MIACASLLTTALQMCILTQNLKECKEIIYGLNMVVVNNSFYIAVVLSVERSIVATLSLSFL